MPLRERCKEMIDKLSQNAILRQGSPVDDLMAFVLAEQGRTADYRLEETMPLILYFEDEAGRADFIKVVREVKPGMVAKRIP